MRLFSIARPSIAFIRQDDPRLGWDAAGPDLPIGVDFDDGKHSLCTVKADPLHEDFLRLGKGEHGHKL
jgi:hypothetical protein